MTSSSWLIGDAVERKRMLEMDRRLRPIRRQVLGIFSIGFVLSSQWIGLWPLAVLAGAAVLFELADRLEARVRKPEYVKFLTWMCVQALIAASLVGLGEIGTLCFLAVPVPTLGSRFSSRGIIAGAAWSLLLLVLSAAVIDAEALTQTPEVVLAPAAVIASIAWFMKGGVLREGLEIRRTSLKDSLTGLSNRAGLMARVEEIAAFRSARGKHVALIAADIDGFKAVNDGHGHPVGDAVLREVAKRLAAEVRASDLFRAGGEEFVILLPGSDEDRAAAIARALCRSIEERPCAGVKVTISCGVAACDSQSFDFQALCKEADDALYAAKRNGRNCVATSRSPITQPSSSPRRDALAAAPMNTSL